MFNSKTFNQPAFRILTTFCFVLSAFVFSANAQIQTDKSTMQMKQSANTATTNSAKFRVTLNGFAVNNQSDDDIMEGDGKGDEVYLRADVWQMDKNGAVVVKQPYKTTILGDTNRQTPRLKAGSASPSEGGGPGGGLRTGDKFPTNTPWQLFGAAGAANGTLPMLLWEGSLAQGADGIVIIPTVWEWDSRDMSRSESEWDKTLDTIFSAVKPHLLRQIISNDTTPFSMARALGDDAVTFGGQTANPAVNLRDKSGTRPIGLFALDGRPVVFLPALLTLNYDSALKATKTSPSNSGLGVFAFRYVDAQDHGDYTLYIQVEKIN